MSHGHMNYLIDFALGGKLFVEEKGVVRFGVDWCGSGLHQIAYRIALELVEEVVGERLVVVYSFLVL